MPVNKPVEQYSGLYFWPQSFSRKAILLASLLLLGFFLAFPSTIMPIPVLLSGFLIILLFFAFLNYFSVYWLKYQPRLLFQRLFLFSFLSRLIFVGYQYLLTYTFQPDSYPFEINAADAWTYHLTALQIRDHLWDNQLSSFLDNLLRDRSDWGYTIYTALIYNIFGPYTLPVRLLNCLWGSLTVVFLAKTAGLLGDLRHARITGILAMLMPSLLWFGGMSLKETLMIFFIVTILYLSTKAVIRKKFNYFDITLIILFTFSLLFFRTVLTILIFISLGFYFFINSARRNSFRTISLLLIFVLITGMLINKYGFTSSIEGTYEQSENYFVTKMETKTKMVGNLNYKLTIVSPFIIAGSIITPFPSFLYLEDRQLAIVIHYQNEIIRNFLYYFAFLGIFYLFRHAFKRNALLLVFALGYMFVLTLTGYSFEDRFQLLSLPPLIVFMSFGIIESKAIWLKRWDYYLVLVIIGIIAWNVFKIAIRQ